MNTIKPKPQTVEILDLDVATCYLLKNNQDPNKNVPILSEELDLAGFGLITLSDLAEAARDVSQPARSVITDTILDLLIVFGPNTKYYIRCV
jgi:hypothetical protein